MTSMTPTHPSDADPAAPLSRRAVVTGVGGVAAAGLLTACGAATATLAAASSIPVGGGTVFADKDVVVTQPTAGEYKAFSATCTHQGCKVKSVADGVIVCPCHGSKFAIADGSVASGPAKSPLPAKSVSVEGGSIVLA